VGAVAGSRRVTCRLTVAVLIASSARLAAQRPPVEREVRVDAIVARRAAVEAGGSLITAQGIYARTSLTAAGGVADRVTGASPVGRAEITSRFLLDPFREWPYGLSVGAGVGVTNLQTQTVWRPYLIALVDLELGEASGWTPAIQLGLGGGARLGISLRSGSGRWR
jgi:hypothetical protein